MTKKELLDRLRELWAERTKVAKKLEKTEIDVLKSQRAVSESDPAYFHNQLVFSTNKLAREMNEIMIKLLLEEYD